MQYYITYKVAIKEKFHDITKQAEGASSSMRKSREFNAGRPEIHLILVTQKRIDTNLFVLIYTLNNICLSQSCTTWLLFPGPYPMCVNIYIFVYFEWDCLEFQFLYITSFFSCKENVFFKKFACFQHNLKMVSRKYRKYLINLLF